LGRGSPLPQSSRKVLRNKELRLDFFEDEKRDLDGLRTTGWRVETLARRVALSSTLPRKSSACSLADCFFKVVDPLA